MNADALTVELDEQRRKVDYNTFDITVQELVSMVVQGQIDIAPAYQRQFRWDVLRQSQFVESIFLGIPVPSLFMATNADGTWELVDGVQRLSSLVHFAGGDDARKKINLKAPLPLSDELEKLKTFRSKLFADLPATTQLYFRLRPIKVVTLSDKSDKVVRFDLFERLNTGGIQLTNQEIRACIFRGEFNDFIERLAQSPDFLNFVRLPKERELDATREEYVLRFFALYHRYKAFNDTLVRFLNNFMRDSAKSFDYADGEKVFKKTFSELRRVFPSGLTRASQKNTPVLLFEAVAVGAALALKKRAKLDGVGAAKWVGSAELRKMTGAGTNYQKQVTARIEYCATKLGA